MNRKLKETIKLKETFRNHVVCSINRTSLKINETVLGFVIFLITETKKRFLDKKIV